MPVYNCPRGHESNEPDFCSECGAKIQGASGSSSLTGAAPGAGTLGSCPDCAAPRTDGSSNFCELCGYNFATGTHGNIPEKPASADSTDAAAPQDAPAGNSAASTGTPAGTPARTSGWMLVAEIDPALVEPGEPPAPSNIVPVAIRLDKPTSLIGRRSDKRGILPEVSLDLDDGVSHRHALLTFGDDGLLSLRDIGSANGTRLNGSDVQPMVDNALHDGDQITLGRWTRITVRSV